MQKQISLPPSIYTIYDFFEKTKNVEWKLNHFSLYKKINNIEINIAKNISNISNLNLYQIDLPISKKIKPEFLIKYLRNIDYRNYYSHNTLFYKLVSIVDDNEWIEYEFYNGNKNKFVVLNSNFIIIFYNDNPSFGQNVSDTKYYHAFKILRDNDKYTLRFEIVLNNMDMDQDIDIINYLNMLIRLLEAVHDKFKVTFDISNILYSNCNSDTEGESEKSMLTEKNIQNHQSSVYNQSNKLVDDEKKRGIH